MRIGKLTADSVVFNFDAVKAPVFGKGPVIHITKWVKHGSAWLDDSHVEYPDTKELRELIRVLTS